VQDPEKLIQTIMLYPSLCFPSYCRYEDITISHFLQLPWVIFQIVEFETNFFSWLAFSNVNLYKKLDRLVHLLSSQFMISFLMDVREKKKLAMRFTNENWLIVVTSFVLEWTFYLICWEMNITFRTIDWTLFENHSIYQICPRIDGQLVVLQAET